MRQAGKIRVIKRESRQAVGVQAQAAAAAAESRAGSERDVKNVVSEWVSEHQRRTDEFRRNFTHLLRDMGFVPPHLSTGR